MMAVNEIVNITKRRFIGTKPRQFEKKSTLTCAPRMFRIFYNIQFLLFITSKKQALTYQQIRIHELGSNGTIVTWIATGWFRGPTLWLGAPKKSQFIKKLNAFVR
jgi:hypothetical protein